MVSTSQSTSTEALNVLVNDFASFNLWANKTVADWLGSKPPELINQEVSTSWKSLNETVFHILYVQENWLATLKTTNIESRYGQQYKGSTSELMLEFINQSQDLAEYIHSLTAEELQEEIEFKVPVRWPEWDDVKYPRFQVILHCLNHSTHHRGQLITIGRSLGFTDPPNTDYMGFLVWAKDARI